MSQEGSKLGQRKRMAQKSLSEEVAFGDTREIKRRGQVTERGVPGRAKSHARDPQCDQAQHTLGAGRRWGWQEMGTARYVVRPRWLHGPSKPSLNGFLPLSQHSGLNFSLSFFQIF